MVRLGLRSRDGRLVLGAGEPAGRLVQAPKAYDPLTRLDLAEQLQRDVLDRLVATGVFSRSQADAVFAAPLHLRVPLRSGMNADR